MNEDELNFWIEKFEMISKNKSWTVEQQLVALNVVTRDPNVVALFEFNDFEAGRKGLKKKNSSLIQLSINK